MVWVSILKRYLILVLPSIKIVINLQVCSWWTTIYLRHWLLWQNHKSMYMKRWTRESCLSYLYWKIICHANAFWQISLQTSSLLQFWKKLVMLKTFFFGWWVPWCMWGWIQVKVEKDNYIAVFDVDAVLGLTDDTIAGAEISGGFTDYVKYMVLKRLF